MKVIEKVIEEVGQISSRPDDPALITRDMVWASSTLFQKTSLEHAVIPHHSTLPFDGTVIQNHGSQSVPSTGHLYMIWTARSHTRISLGLR